MLRHDHRGARVWVAELGAQLDDLLHQEELLMLDGHQALLEAVAVVLDVLLLALETFDFLPLALTRGLGGGAISEDALDTTLLLLIFGLGSFPV